MSAARPSLVALAKQYAERICAEYDMPVNEHEFRTWLRTAYFAGYEAGITRASRLLDRDLGLTEAP